MQRLSPLMVMVLVLLSAVSMVRSAEVLVGLRQNNLEALEAALSLVSDPFSEQYANYWTRDKVAKFIAPDADVAHRVAAELWKLGALRVSSSIAGDHLLAEFRDSRVSSVLSWSHNDVHGVSLVPSKASKAREYRKVGQALSGYLGDPNSQREAYGIPKDVRGSHPRSLQMVWGPGTYGYLESDMDAFYAKYDVNASVSLIQREGFHGTPGGDNFGEATLDVTYITSIGQGIPTIISNTNDSHSTEETTGFGTAFLKFLVDLGERPDEKLPLVLSFSLGSLSYDACNMLCTLIHNYLPGATQKECEEYISEQRQVCMFGSSWEVDRMNVEFMKLGLRGVTLLAASGDGGSHFSFVPFDEGSAMGQALNKISCAYQMPTFPGESPYVLAVGGTTWEGASPKEPVHWPSGGAGFSWRFPMPDYQKDIVNAYLKSESDLGRLPPKESFNASNRAYPDVSALGDNVPMIVVGKERITGGTSASAPEFAGVVSLLNDVRLQKGLSPLGFVNPRLYKLSPKATDAFFDVVQGHTKCAIGDYCCDNGFYAAEGWDGATGFGSPRWDGLVKMLGSDDKIRRNSIDA
eukprot:TRINITY_DN603_c0_g8_i1.p1 TRINITY_DN603_c0_g8~~TRINITY_DN603_c0_g8_i1.p1  ORF type:complete len:578 (+),score=153.38 TRINITY_DN603_c0_g8_i1:184-1917(+)